MSIDLICLDADDTLWHHGSHYELANRRFVELLAPYATVEDIEACHAEVEHRNIGTYGYGAKGFTLSMMEAALLLGQHRIDSATLSAILDVGRAMISHPIDLLPGVEDALERLARLGALVLVTKGDLFLQESKLAHSGLAKRFAAIEIVSNKEPQTYRRIAARYGANPDQMVMAGNSVRSDILPVLEMGGYAALVPYDVVWDHEAAEMPTGHSRFREIATLGELPNWIEQLVEEEKDLR